MTTIPASAVSPSHTYPFFRAALPCHHGYVQFFCPLPLTYGPSLWNPARGTPFSQLVVCSSGALCPEISPQYFSQICIGPRKYLHRFAAISQLFLAHLAWIYHLSFYVFHFCACSFCCSVLTSLGVFIFWSAYPLAPLRPFPPRGVPFFQEPWPLALRQVLPAPPHLFGYDLL